MEPVVTLNRSSISQYTARKSLGHIADDVLTPISNQERERIERQKQRIAASRRSLHNSGRTPDGRNAARPGAPTQPAKASFNSNELKEHYSMCIKLSTTNKINTKNAFGLHLIDYMSDLVKNHQEGRMNFKLASSALDAGSKIYCHRVDCVHAEAQKVASGLVMALDKESDSPRKRNGNESGEEGDGDMDNDGADPDKHTKAKKRRGPNKPGRAIAQNLSIISTTKIESNLEIDPLFHKLSSAIGQNSADCLLMLNLKCNEDNQLLLDSRASWNNISSTQIGGSSMSIEPFLQFINAINSNSQICPKIANFEFSNRTDATDLMGTSDIDGRQSSLPQLRDGDSQRSSFRFDINADVDEVETGTIDDHHDFGLGDFDDNVPENEDFIHTVQKKATIQSVNLEDVQISDLLKILSDQPNDYSYFNRQLSSAWAGPSHWKANPFRKNLLPIPDGLKSTRKRLNLPTETNFLDENVLKGDQVASKGLVLKKKTLENWRNASDDLILPDDYNYESERLARPFIKNAKGFDFTNSNKVEVAVSEGDISRLNFDDGAGIDAPDDYEDFRPGSAGFPSEAYGSQTSFSNIPSSQATVTDTMPFNLIDAPESIQSINLPFAKYAKKINVKLLKKSMWDTLTTNLEETPLPLPPQTTKCMTMEKTFYSMYKSMPNRISQSMATNLSTPIAFVTLLHIANEKNLQLSMAEDLHDFKIMQEVKEGDDTEDS